MKRKRITIKKKVVATLKPKQLKTVTGGRGAGGDGAGTYTSGGDITRCCGHGH